MYGMNESPTLRRTLTLPILVFYGVGTIMGAGIYALVGKVAGMSGMFTPVAFFTSAVLAGLTGYSYAVLSSKYPLSSGEAVYLQKAFKIKALSLLVGLAVALSGIVSSAAISNGFVGYFQVFVDMPGWLINTAVIVSMGLLAIWGIKQSAIAATVVTIIEVLGLIIVIWVTKDNFLTIPDRLPEMIPPMEFASWQAIFAGAFLAFYAFIGFEDLVNVAEEVKNPEKTLPRALGISIVTVTILYVLLGVVGI